MQKLMEIGDVFEAKECGTVIVGINPTLEGFNRSTLKSLVGQQITIRKAHNQEMLVEVVNIRLSFSFIGNKMFGICLGKHVTPSDIPKGSTVYV